MSHSSVSAVAIAAAPIHLAADPAAPIVQAARLLLSHLEHGRRIDAAMLRAAMESAFSATDADGAWTWKTAYDACETATVLFLRKFGPAMRAKAASPAAMLTMLAKVTGLLPTHTRRTEESDALQQFSTPIVLGFAASVAAAITRTDVVLEPSAGTGLLAILAELAGASLVLNELSDTRAGILDRLFSSVSGTRFDAAHIDDHLDAGIVPSVVLMNPPFSALAHVDRRVGDAALRHVASALARLPDGGRLVTITGAGFAPDNPAWTDAFVRLQERGRIVFSAAIDGAVYAKHGTATDTRLTVIDRLSADDATGFPPSPGLAPGVATRAKFVEAIEAGGVAAMEVLARDLKALGLYAARSLSYEGVEYELVEYKLTDEQIRIYDAYAGAFSIIHNNLDAAMRAANITGETGTLNAQAKSAARSAFESAKQRFFSHLITAMKTPTLIGSVERDLKVGHAAVIQIVSTGEALMEHRLAEIPTEEWGDIQVDITPREYVLDYLAHSFPTQLYEPFEDSEGNLSSRPAYRDGQPVQSREAVARRDRLIEKLASLPPVHGALDQIVQRFGADMVAEVTGRSRRIVRKTGSDRIDRLVVENRAGSANLAETQAFMDDAKRILVFSDAGGTGRSYHAELSARNRRLRIHYLLEAGWKADAAIQELGRTNRTNQVQPPLFRPIATNVKAEKRFLSTIARRLDTLGAITKGQRQTGGQGLFRAEDNLESHYARDALRQLYLLLVLGKVQGCSLQTFEDATGLKLTDANGIKDELPPITTFLNRLLALTIDLQNILFVAFEQLLAARIEGAIASGTYDVGLETLTAERFTVTDRQTVYTHSGTAADTRLLTIAQRQRNRPVTLDDALERLSDPRAMLLINAQSGRAAIQVPARSVMLDDGQVERRVRLVRPMEHPVMALATMPQTHWREADRDTFARAWSAELADVPEFADSEIHIVAGLLLPIWKRLPNELTRVYRLQTDTGERIIGRKVSPAWVASATAIGVVTLTPDAALAALLDGKTVVDLAEGLQLRRVRVMGANRIELTGFTDAMRERLSAYGLFHEIISWKLRMFVPTDGAGIDVLRKVLERYPVARVSERAA
jgi:predicted RNA methylase